LSAKIRHLKKTFATTHQTKFKKILVSGCSFTYNNSETDICTWPYYLKDLTGIETVFDASQSGAGSNHIFNSIVYECETNSLINADDTLIIVMWSGLSRTDVVAKRLVTDHWHSMSNYCFDEQFATLSIFNSVEGNTYIDDLCKKYKKIISPDAQIIESLIKIQALKQYLISKKFNHVFLSWMDPAIELKHINTTMTMPLDQVPYLYEFAEQKQMLETDSHPSPDGHLQWVKECLLPYLSVCGLTTDLNTV
jgi:hypothetical protein